MASSLRCGRENLLYCLKAGPAGPATTRRSPGAGLTQRNRWSLQLQVAVGPSGSDRASHAKGRHVCSRHEPRDDVPALGPLGSAGQPDRPRDHELRVHRRRVDQLCGHGRRDRRGHQLLRHRRRLWRAAVAGYGQRVRDLGGDHRPVVAAQPAPRCHRPGHQGVPADGTGAERPPAVRLPHPARVRGEPAAAADRSH